MITKIIAAFPGTGKTYYHNRNLLVTLDSDSSKFDKKNFPDNYIRHIKENIGKYEIIFVSSHKEVREALQNNCLFFYLVYPDKSRKKEYLEKYKDRGSPEAFIKLLDNNWEIWLDECYTNTYGCINIEMSWGNISNIIEDWKI